MLRGGIFFAEGMYFAMECRLQTFDPKYETFVRPDTKNVILIDSVINNEQVVTKFEKQLYTIRVSRNSFVRSNVRKQESKVDPDTTMRLFNQL